MDRRVEELAHNLQAHSLGDRAFIPPVGQKRPADSTDLNPKSKGSKHIDLEAILADKRRGPHRKDRKVKKWTTEEDQALRDAVATHGARNWKLVATMVPGRDHTQCLQRWTKCLAPGLRKGTWTPEEDNILTQCVYQQLDANRPAVNGKPRKIQWGEVCKHIEGRTAKQCRERWVNNLDPSIYRGAWTKEEDERMKELYKKYGASWAAIAKEIPGRTENGVKIRWKALARTKEGAAALAAAPKPRAKKKSDSDEEDEDSSSSSDNEGENEMGSDGEAEREQPHAPPSLSQNQLSAVLTSLGPAGPVFHIQPMMAAPAHQFMQPSVIQPNDSATLISSFPGTGFPGTASLFPLMQLGSNASQSGISDASQPTMEEQLRFMQSSGSVRFPSFSSGFQMPQIVPSAVPVKRDRSDSHSSGRTGYLNMNYVGGRVQAQEDEEKTSTASSASSLSGFASAFGMLKGAPSKMTSSSVPIPMPAQVSGQQQGLVSPSFPFGTSPGSTGLAMNNPSFPMQSTPYMFQAFPVNGQMSSMYPTGPATVYPQSQNMPMMMMNPSVQQPEFYSLSGGYDAKNNG